MSHVQHYVFFNDGDNPDVHALVLKHNEDGTLNLYIIRESGAPEVKNGISEGEGGNYWHK